MAFTIALCIVLLWCSTTLGENQELAIENDSNLEKRATGKINLALKRPTVQINTGWNGHSSRAVDGITNSNYHAHSCTHTHKAYQPWWRVDLQKQIIVTSVKITNRGDCCHKRLSNFQIHIGNSLARNGNANPRCGGRYSLGKGETREIRCPRPMRGRYVNIIIRHRRTYLTLCEVQVFGQGSCKNANWWHSFDRTGWSKCPSRFPYINGLYRSRARWFSHDKIYLLEQARCCNNGNSNAHCVHANWVHSFDRRNHWNLCPRGYYLSGLYRSHGHNLHNIEHAWCCKPRGAPNSYKSCYHENVWKRFDWDKKGMVSCTRPGHFITGLYRSSCDLMYCIELFKCCQMQTKQVLGNAVCSATGDPHYRTFDGRMIHFMGRCQYVLAKDIHNTFTVLGRNEVCGNRRVTCTMEVTVKVNNLEIVIQRGGRVTVFGVAKRLPYIHRGVIVKRVGRNVEVITNIGLTVRYDCVYNVYIIVSGKYRGKTRGICGNYNGNPNDLLKSDNRFTKNDQHFANSWKVDLSCPNSPRPSNPCLTAGARARAAKRKCGLLRRSPFSACRNHVNVNSGFIQDCEYDVCACKDNLVSCLCEEYDAYVTTCGYAGVNIRWKHLPQFRHCDTTRFPCASAPCLNGGVCTNHGRSFKCKCPPYFYGHRCQKEVTATCSATGDPHYKTFDGRRYDFMGICEYVLSKDLGNNFLVLTRNERCRGRFSCVFSVTVTVKGLKIKINRNGHFTVFGFKKPAPYRNQGITVSKHGARKIRITTDIGVTVQFDGVNNVFLTISARYRGKTVGLCGNYNGNSRDEFLDVNSRPSSFHHFVDSWKIDHSCPNSPPLINPCKTASKIAQHAKKKCQLLKRAPFSKCHNSVNQNSGFIQNCEFDVCACENHPSSCLCEEFDDYATSCSLVGVPIHWKNLHQFKECKLPCAAAPCRNGATCSNHGNSYRCTCARGYTGIRCDKRTCTNPKALGMENGKIRDNRITASSVWDRNHGAANARLNFAKKSGSWSSRRNDHKQWLQVDFKYTATITDILTQGRGRYHQWVRSYIVSYSNNGENFKFYRKRRKVKVFPANNDMRRIVRNPLHPVIVARFIRIHPKTWNHHISMRVEFNGCFEGQPCAEEPCQNEGICSSVGEKISCSCLAGYYGDRCEQKECKNPVPLGVENGEIPDSHISASSEWDVNHGVVNSRLNFQARGRRQGAWSSRHNNRHQWLQINFNRQATVTDILTQGRSNYNQWVTSYTVSYSNDGLNFFSYRVNGKIKVFGGNRDRTTIVRQRVSPVIVAGYIRIHPWTWHSHISMRVGFRGCLKDWPCDENPCRNGGTCVDYRGGYLCACRKGWTGRNCEFDVGRCVPRG